MFGDLALQFVGAGDVGLVAFFLDQADLRGVLAAPGQVEGEDPAAADADVQPGAQGVESGGHQSLAGQAGGARPPQHEHRSHGEYEDPGGDQRDRAVRDRPQRLPHGRRCWDG
ncbi:hypothetical protein GCM10017774_37820 [Lentzea cavernae]|uniref:Uncharacterized protein n=1 Tax=Lentzea cavernae TaxID=2020703 RepID=A0ABQ3ME92_9PSEU|nr:hypothetical protein GCM10017774_37820 [Lentzea cavernae]